MTTKEIITREPMANKRGQIEAMFNAIAAKYDVVNRIISWRMDKKWRNDVLRLVNKKDPEKVLDIATGTGEMAMLLATANAKYILGVDIAQKMLDIANKKIKQLNLQGRVHTQIQNSENLSLPDYCFDVVTIVYGVRNFENPEAGLKECHRVLNDKGAIVILETSVPQHPLIRLGYLLYVKKIMPLLASLFSKNKSAYTYLCNSAVLFPYGNDFIRLLETTGFKNIISYPKMFGVSTIYYAEK